MTTKTNSPDNLQSTNLGADDDTMRVRIAGMTPQERELVLLTLARLVPADQREDTLRELQAVAERFGACSRGQTLH